VHKTDASKQILLETKMLNIPCVLFAGGKSSRMGEDKALLPFGDSPTLTYYQHSRLSKIFKTVYISCKEKSKFSLQANYIEDIKTSDCFAPTLGFVSTFEQIQEDSFFALSVDSPFVGEDIIIKLLEMDAPSFDATIAKSPQGVQPLCGIYHRSLTPSFEKMLEENRHKLNLLLQNAKTTYVSFENENSFLNLNHPHEYEQALKLLNN